VRGRFAFEFPHIAGDTMAFASGTPLSEIGMLAMQPMSDVRHAASHADSQERRLTDARARATSGKRTPQERK
jgi:hypothetical protein